MTWKVLEGCLKTFVRVIHTGGVLLGNLGGGVRPAVGNPDTISEKIV